MKNILEFSIFESGQEVNTNPPGIPPLSISGEIKFEPIKYDGGEFHKDDYDPDSLLKGTDYVSVNLYKPKYEKGSKFLFDLFPPFYFLAIYQSREGDLYFQIFEKGDLRRTHPIPHYPVPTGAHSRDEVNQMERDNKAFPLPIKDLNQETLFGI